jgi:tetratricopeptide (TPR) repeat protein
MTRALLTLVLLAAALSLSATPIALPRPNEKWITLQVDELTFVSSVSASETMEIARDLLRMREAAGRITNLNVRSSKPMRIILFASEGAFAPYREAISRMDQANVRGIFTGSDSTHFIVMVHDGAHPVERTVYHELTHYFLRNSVDGIPIWANEGAAEYYSTFHSSVDAVQVGNPILEHLQVLRSEPFLPLRKLLATTAQSSHYRREKQGIFYAQSWALFHYLMNDDARRAGLRKYLGLVGEGKPADDAFARAFDRSYDAMERELGAYVRGKTFVVREYPLSDLAVPDVPKPQPLSRAELLFELGHLLVHTTKPTPAVAKRMLEEALSLDTELAGAHADLGRLHDIAGRRREAEAAYARAMELGSDDPLVYLVVGLGTLERSQTVAGADSVAAVRQARKAFERAALLDPRSAITWANIGATYAMSAEDPAPGIAALEKSLAMGFDDPNVALNLVRLYTRVDRRAEAQRLIDTVLTRNATPETLAFARDLLVLADAEHLNANGKTAEAAQLARELAGRTKEPTLKAHLEMRIEQFDGVTNYNRAVYALGDAVAKANAGQLTEALAIVDRVLSESTDQSLLHEAKRLRAEFEWKAKLKR